MIFLKIHEGKGRTVIALCDEELLGKVLEDEKARLDLTKKGFFEGKKMEKEKALAFIKKISEDNACDFNAVGKESVLVLKEFHKVVAKKVAGVPHAIVFHV